MSANKFYRINGVHNVFVYNSATSTYDTSVNGFSPSCAEYVEGKIDQYTILFIVCDATDVNRKVIIESQSGAVTTTSDRILSTNDTFIWARGKVFGFSYNAITDITKVDNELIMTFADGTVEDFPEGILYTAGHNITIDANNIIEAKGYSFDGNSNFIENYTTNAASSGVSKTHVDGDNNQSAADNQHVSGKYNAIDATKAFIFGWGTSSQRKNIFTITPSGTSHSFEDVTCGGTDTAPENRLSDLHKSSASDWVVIGY